VGDCEVPHGGACDCIVVVVVVVGIVVVVVCCVLFFLLQVHLSTIIYYE
jgi:hypothetical protein